MQFFTIAVKIYPFINNVNSLRILIARIESSQSVMDGDGAGGKEEEEKAE